MIDIQALVQRAGEQLEAAKQRDFSHFSQTARPQWERQISENAGFSQFPTSKQEGQQQVSETCPETSAERVARRVTFQEWEKWEKREKPENRAGTACSRVGNEWETVGNPSRVVSLRDARLRRREPTDFASLPADLPAEPRVWANRLAALDPRDDPCPGLRSGDWLAIRHMIFDFLCRHAERAIELDWSEIELFGVHPGLGVARLDCCGALIVGPLAQMTVVSEVQKDLIRGQEGLAYRRRKLEPAAPVWMFKRVGSPDTA